MIGRIRQRLAAAERDAGMTLTELVMAMVILTIISAPIAAMTIVGYKAWTSSTTSLYVSHDRQLLQTYFGRDAASATTATVGVAGTCSPAGVTVSNWVADLQWNGARTTTGTWGHSYEADYGTTTIGGKPVLQRWLCTDGVSTTVTTVAHSLSLTAATPVTATCWINPAQPTSSGNCPAATASKPVSMAITVTDAAETVYTIATEQRAAG